MKGITKEEWVKICFFFFCQNGEEPVSFEKFHRCRLDAMAPTVYIIGLPNNMLHAVEMSTTIKEKLAGPNP